MSIQLPRLLLALLLVAVTDDPRNPAEAVVVAPSAFSFNNLRSCVKSADPDRTLTGTKEEDEEDDDEEEEEEEDDDEEEEEEEGTI